MTGPSVVITGAGSIGAAEAHALQAAGARIKVMDSGGPRGASASFGSINASFPHDAARFCLRREGIAAGRALP